MVSVPVLALSTLAAMTSPAARADGAGYFQAPSENIYCDLGTADSTTYAVCEIKEHTWTAPSRPTSCEGEWGDRVTLRRGSAAQMTCHGDTVQGPGYPVLQYGQSRSVNSLVCQSQQAGITCTDNITNHYFRLARDSYELH